MALLQNVIQRGTHAARPAAGSAGVLYFETDTGQLFRDSGSVWQLDDTTLLYTAKGQLLAASASGAVGALAAGTDGQVLTADSAQSLGVKWATAGAAAGVVQLAQTILGSTAASITFSGISGSYSGLWLVYQGRGDVSATQTDLLVQFNGDTGSNYDHELIQFSGNASSVSDTEAFGQTALKVSYVTGATATASVADVADLRIPNYAGTTFHKAALCTSGLKQGTSTGNLFVVLRHGWWRSTAAITSIKLLPGSGNFVAGTVATLYGLT